MNELSAVLGMPDGAGKTAALAAWVQGLFETGREPVLVGGAAVELYTKGGYTSGDLDMVGAPTPRARRALAAAGFRKQGRHWIHEEAEVFLEFPSNALFAGEKASRRRFGRQWVVILTAEDLVAERLSAWQSWRSPVDGANAWLVFRALDVRLDRRRLRRRVAARECEAAWSALLGLARRARREKLSEEDVERWALQGP